MNENFVSMLAVLRESVPAPPPLGTLIADEHERFEFYSRVIQGEADHLRSLLLRLFEQDPDKAMAEAALTKYIDRVMQALTVQEAIEWMGTVYPLIEAHSFAQQRLREWLLLKQAIAGEQIPDSEFWMGSAWMQRKLVDESTRPEVLSALAKNATTKRLRAIAARKLSGLEPSGESPTLT